MNNECKELQKAIPDLLLGTLAPEAARELEAHISDCPACALERLAFERTFGRMRTLEDVAPPRHFFVYAPERRTNPWRAFLSLAPAWRACAAVALLAGLLGVGFAAFRLTLRAEGGALTISFGRPPAPMPAPAAPPAIDAAALESRILAAVKEKSREEASQWVNTLRAEIVRVQSRLTRDQNDALVQALSVVEGRMNARVEQAANMLQERSSQGIAGLYDTVSLERQADVAELDARLSRLASSSAAQASETTAILETLLQVAELRNRQ